MKKGYQKLLIFELILLSFLMINSFIFNFLTGYKNVFFLILVLGLFLWLLGFEKDRHRYIKDFILDETVIIIIFLLIYYSLGIFVGFLKTDFFRFNSLKKFIIPSVLYIILRELFRYLSLSKSDGNKFLTVLSVLTIFLMDVSTNIYLSDLNSKYSTFIFISTIIIPALFSNIAFSYITKKLGYKPVLFYCLVMELYGYVLPIVPDGGVYISTIIAISLPAIVCYYANSFFEKTIKQKVNRQTVKKKRPYVSLSIIGVLVFVMVYFTSGFFNHWAIVIASNSMLPKITKGDIVIIDKINNHYDRIDVGDILAYRYNDKIIVHRVVEVTKSDNQYFFKTKGDANINKDEVLITQKMVVGVVNVKIPYLGLPTVWLKSL